MKEIKFRGKRIDSNEWVYGYLYIHNGYSGVSALIRGDKILDTEVDINTIGQYTGLKDKNGIEVYEGDIVMLDNVNPNSVKAIISFHQLQWIFNVIDEARYYPLYRDFTTTRKNKQYQDGYVEVIGNIYDNKEEITK